MNWILIVIIAYFLVALEVILDKFLISSERVSHPAIYAFYSGALSILTIFLFPFGFHGVVFLRFVQFLITGIIFTYGILFLFFAFKKSEASRVTTVVGATIPIITYFLSVFFLKEHLDGIHLLGIAALIFGGVLISWKFSVDKKQNFFSGFRQAILAGIFLAVSYTSMKGLFAHDGFINVFIWTRIGVAAGALSLLSVPSWRNLIFKSLSHFKKPEKEHQNSGVLFAFNKLLGGIGSILLNFSISLGSVTVINALVSLEYAFIFIMGGIFSFWLPRIFQEKMNMENAIQKFSAIIIIAIGLILVSSNK